MGFLGRGRGGKGRSGGIHASTSKSKDRDNSKSNSSSGSRGRDGRSGGSSDPTSNPKFDNKDFSKESLRITVGNDMYKEGHRLPNNPLAERLGPPVDSSNMSSKHSTDYDDSDLYKQEARFYRDGSRDRLLGDNHRGGSYERDSHVRSSRDAEDRYRSDRGKRDDYHRDHDRGSRDRRDSGRRTDSGDYLDRHKDRNRESSAYDDRARNSQERSSDSNRGLYRDSPRHYDSNPELIRQGSAQGLETKLQPINIPPAPKPLKSILKKSTSGSTTSDANNSNPAGAAVYSTPNSAMNVEMVGGLFPVQGRQGHSGVEDRLGPPQTIGRGSLDSQRRPQKPGLPGMSSYMDIEDEEKFLYGDDNNDHPDRDRYSSSYQPRGGYSGPNHEQQPPHHQQQPTHHQQQQQPPNHQQQPPRQLPQRTEMSQFDNPVSALRSVDLDAQLAALRAGGLESQLAALRASGIESQLAALQSVGLGGQISAPRSSGMDSQLSSLGSGFPSNIQRDNYANQQYQQDVHRMPADGAMNPPVPQASVPATQQESSYNTDLLSLFTSNPQSFPQSVPSTYSAAVAPQEEKSKPAYDPTIENILKSIGFDFEMSKRMQEKAQKPKEEEVFGINEGATFLEGGLSDDIKKKLFKEKEESMVDEFLREIKSRPIRSEMEHRYDKDLDRKYESRDNDRKYDRVDDRKYDRDVDARYERSRSRSVEHYYDKDRSRVYHRSRSRSRDRFDREFSTDRKYVRKRSRSRSRSIECRRDLRRSRSRSSRSSSLSSVSSKSSSHSRERHYNKRRNSQTRSSLEDGQSYPTQESLSSGIPFQRQVSTTAYTPYTQNAPAYSQPQTTYPPPGLSVPPPGPPFIQPPGIPPPQMPFPGPPPMGWQQLPPYNYTMPHPGYMGPEMQLQRYPPPGFPPVSQPDKVSAELVPPGTQTLINQTSTSSGKNKSSDSRSRTLHAIHIDKSNKKKESKKEPSNNSTPSDNVVEQKTITIEKKTISITSNESNRTVLPPKNDTRKIAAEVQKKLGTNKPENVKRLAESPKKVMTSKEKFKLIKDRQVRMKRIESLEDELTKLRRQQNEIMRKRRRQKYMPKDPVLTQNSKLQDEISAQITKLKKVSDENLKTLRECIVKDDDGPPMSKKMKVTVNESSSEKVGKKDSSLKPPPKETVKEIKKVEKRYEFFDPGGHQCKLCNVTSGSVYSVLQHLHGKKHQKNMNHYDRPWVPAAMSNPPKFNSKATVVTLPVKGQEFLVPCKAFFCTLCKEFAGDEACADFHLKSESHYLKFEKCMGEPSFFDTKKPDKKTTTPNKPDQVKVENKKQSPQEKQQAEKRVKEKEKKWEKPVTELEDTNDPLQKAGFEKYTPKGKTTMELKISQSGENQTDTKKSKDKDGSKQKEDSNKDSENKGKIAIHISNKTGIKPVPVTGKMPQKKNPLLPPWKPMSKQTGSIKSNLLPIRKQTKTESEKPPSLDLFLSIGGGDDKAKPLPIMKGKIGDGKSKVTAQDILEAFSGKRKDGNADPEEENKAKQKISKEEIEDLKLLGINPEEHKLLAEKKDPPPPSQNLSLPPVLQSVSNINQTKIDETISKSKNVEKVADSSQAVSKSTNVTKSDGSSEAEPKTKIEVQSVSNTNLTKVEDSSEAVSVSSSLMKNEAKSEMEKKEDTNITESSKVEENFKLPETDVGKEIYSSEEPKVENDPALSLAGTVTNIDVTNSVSEEDKLEKNSNVQSADLISSSSIPLPTDTINTDIEMRDSEKAPAVDEVASDVDDLASDTSGISMHMGSDFEVLDECEADES